MSNDYFDTGDYTALTRLTQARAESVNAIATAVEAGFDKLPSEANIKQGKVNYAVDTGAANAYVASLPHTPASYADGLEVNVKIANTNTSTSCTINVNGLGAVAIKDYAGNNPAVGDLAAGAVIPLRHNGTHFRIVGQTVGGAAAAAASAAAAAVSASNAGADAVATAADRVQTGLDRAASAASATASSTSESNAAASAAAASAVASPWTFDTSTTMADPGTGDIRFNNATVSSVTALALSALTADSGNPDVSDFVAAWDDSTNSTHRGSITIKKRGTPSTFAIFSVSGSVTDNGAWLQVAVTHVASSGAFGAADVLHVQFTATGNSGSGDLSGPASATDSAIALFDGITGKLLKDSLVLLSSLLKADGSVVMTGDLQIGAGKGIIFEGTTADAYETTLSAGEPTADRTVTMPNATGTLALLENPQSWTRAQTADTYALTHNTAWDATAYQHLTVTVDGSNFTIADPTAQTAKAFYAVYVSYSTTHTLSFGASYKGVSSITPSNTSGKHDVFFFRSDGTNMECVGYKLDVGA